MMSNQYKGQAKVAHAQGRAQQTAAYKQAYNLEEEARSDSLLASTNMMRQRENQTATQASVRNAAAASSFTSQGSGQQAEIATADIFETAIRDMALSNAISDSNKRYAADVTRFQGNLAMQQAETAATQYTKLAKTAKTSALLQLGSTAFGAGAALLNNIGVDAKIPGTDKYGKPIMTDNPKYMNPLAYGNNAYNLAGAGLQFAPGTLGAGKDSLSGASSSLYQLFTQLFPSQ